MKKILIVEDNNISRKILANIVAEKYSVIEASNGAEGLGILKARYKDIDLVLLDLAMPVMSGYEFLETIQDDEQLKSVPIIVSTAMTDLEDEEKCIELGAIDYIIKPYNARAVMARIKNILRLIDYTKKVKSLETESNYDALTGFKNRRALYTDVSALGTSTEHIGIAFVDVNSLKETNDSMGHEAGDQLIISVCKILNRVFPSANKYRIGGDEFLLIIEDVEKADFDRQISEIKSSWSDEISAAVGDVWLEQGDNIVAAISIADRKMYYDKNEFYGSKTGGTRRNARVADMDIFNNTQELAENLPAGFFIYHADGDEDLMFYNDELVRIFECDTREEFEAHVGNSFRGIVHPDDLKLVEGDIGSQITLNNNKDYVEYRIITKKGNVRTIRDYGRFVHTRTYGDVFYVLLFTD